MSHETSHDGDHGEHSIHLPDPSLWPIFCGVAALFIGLGLVWWSRERDSAISGIFLGIACVVILLAAAGWAYEDNRMRRKAEDVDAKTRKSPRFTQVITFTIAEGQAAVARAAGGVVPALDAADGLVRDLAGFEDFRVTISPGESGPLQVLAETTWSERQDLSVYDSAQRTLLDVINSHNEEIVPGSVQAFDMEVVRDTKETSFSLARGAVFALLGSFIVGGFMFGAGLNLFASDKVASEGGDGGGTPTAPADPFNLVVEARDNFFTPTTLQMAANSPVTVTLNNAGRTMHNIHFFTAQNGDTLADGAEGGIIAAGASETLSFQSPGVGSYYFHCDLHPGMEGTLEVIEAPAGGGGGAAAAGDPLNPAIEAQDNLFVQTEITVTANSTINVSFTNSGKTPHNVTFYQSASDLTVIGGSAGGNITMAGETKTFSFESPGPGEYFYHCDLHVDQMKGKLIVQ